MEEEDLAECDTDSVNTEQYLCASAQLLIADCHCARGWGWFMDIIILYLIVDFLILLTIFRFIFFCIT